VSEGAFEQREVSILFADLRGFTALGAAWPADAVIDVLNRFLAAMSDTVIEHHGSVHKFLGDALMAVFGAPQASQDHALQALCCAARMQRGMDAINAGNRARGLPDVYCGIGVNTGTVMAGWLGSPRHREYSVVGDAVNLASRIESFSLRGQVLLGESTWTLAHEHMETGEPSEVLLKGQPQPVRVYELLAIPQHRLAVARRDLRRSQRVRVRLPFTYQLLEGKIVHAELRAGIVHDIGYQGLLAELYGPVAAYTDIRLSVDLAPFGHRAADIYGKVLQLSERDGALFAAVEFTSVTLQSDIGIRQFVQMLLQGSPAAD